jgi:hypothetical protein
MKLLLILFYDELQCAVLLLNQKMTECIIHLVHLILINYYFYYVVVFLIVYMLAR